MRKAVIYVCFVLLVGCVTQKKTEIKTWGDPKKARILKVFAKKSLTKLIFSFGFPHGTSDNRKLPKEHIIYVYRILNVTQKREIKKQPFRIVKENTLNLLYPLKKRKLYSFIYFQINEKDIIIQVRWIFYVHYEDGTDYESLIAEVKLNGS